MNKAEICTASVVHRCHTLVYNPVVQGGKIIVKVAEFLSHVIA